MKKIFIFLFCVLLPAGYSAEKALELPLAEVILYSSGVGVFEHTGKLPEGKSRAVFRFTKEQLNDLLKSLLLSAEPGSGIRVRSVSYPSQKTLKDLMRETRIRMDQVNSLADLFRNMKGNEFSLILADGSSFKGVLTGVESRTELAKQGSSITKNYAAFLTDKGFRSVGIFEISSAVPSDPSLVQEMKRSLAKIAEYNRDDSRELELVFSAEKGGVLHASYVMEAPVWKSSYRLEIADPETKKASLQGWAILENPSANAWKNVSVTLVAGRPSSFVQDLYTSLYLKRPVFGPVPEKGHSNSTDCEGMCDTAFPRVASAGVYKAKRNRMMSGAGAAAAAAEKAGELCFYKVPGKVDLESGRSAMFKLLSCTIPAEKVSFYSLRGNAPHPANAVLIRNDAKLLLPAGPVTVYEENTYGGDARLEDLPSGQEKLLSYGTDLEIRSFPAERKNVSNMISELKIVRGMLHLTGKSVTETKGAFQNRSAKKRILIVELPKRASEKIASSTVPAEEIPGGYRFRLVLDPGKKTEFVCRLEEPSLRVFSMNENLDFTKFTFASNGIDFSPAVRGKIGKLSSASRDMSELRRKISLSEKKIRDLEKMHERTRLSLDKISSGEYRNTLQQRLASFDRQLDAEYRNRESLEKNLLKVRTSIDELLSR